MRLRERGRQIDEVWNPIPGYEEDQRGSKAAQMLHHGQRRVVAEDPQYHVNAEGIYEATGVRVHEVAAREKCYGWMEITPSVGVRERNQGQRESDHRGSDQENAECCPVSPPRIERESDPRLQLPPHRR
jgi:hypothetical protein